MSRDANMLTYVLTIVLIMLKTGKRLFIWVLFGPFLVYSYKIHKENQISRQNTCLLREHANKVDKLAEESFAFHSRNASKNLHSLNNSTKTLSTMTKQLKDNNWSYS